MCPSRCLLVSTLLLAAASATATAVPLPLSCSGHGPPWRLDLRPKAAQLVLPPARPQAFAGRASADDFARSLGWRGRAPGTRADLVAFVREETCTDASAVEHPFAARVSLPDGRFLAGCCERSEPGLAEEDTPRIEPTPAPALTPLATAGDWISSLSTFLPAIEACKGESPRTEAIVFAGVRPDRAVHLVLRLPGPRFADCVLPPDRGPVRIELRPPDAVLIAIEEAAVFTLHPFTPPEEACWRSQPVTDGRGRTLGHMSLKGC